MIVAQVSDTHIKPQGQLAYKKVDTQKYLKNCIEHINKLYPKPDLVVFSGDITDSGKISEFELFKKIVEELTVPYCIVPGNHDKKDGLKKVFSEHIWYKDEKFLHFTIDNLPIQIIGLDSTCIDKPFGELCKSRLSWFEEKLNNSSKKALVFMHHPPVNIGIKHMDIQNLLFGVDEFARLVKKFNTQILGIACGHVHRSSHTLWNNVIISTAPSSSHQVVLDLQENPKPAFILEPPAIHLHCLQEDNTLVTHISYIGSFDGPYAFYDKDGKLID